MPRQQFLVVHKEDGYGFGYLVTARHVAKKVRPHGDVVLRVNKKGEDAVYEAATATRPVRPGGMMP